MAKFSLLGTSALRSTIILGFSLSVAGPAFGQSAQIQRTSAQPSGDPAQDEAGSNEAESEDEQGATTGADIVVTGSRIPRPHLDSVIPILSVDADQVAEVGQMAIGDQLNRLPQFKATFSQANAGRGLGTAGQNNLDLRGVGTARTLVLVNGRRHVSSVPGRFRWDVSFVPVDLIERIDIVTGGNSAIYGSDAVSGVVNFILRRSFDGIQLRGQAGISDEGDSPSYFAAGILGRNFADGRGNVTLAAEYVKNEALYYTERDQGRNVGAFQLVQNTGSQLNPANGPIRGPEPAAGDGIPDTAFIKGLRSVSQSVGGTFTAACPTAPAAGESSAAFAARRAAACNGIPSPSSTNSLAQFGTAFAFLPDGTLVPQGCTTSFQPFGSSRCIGGLGSTGREDGMFEPDVQRITGSLLARFEISPALQPFVEASFSRVDLVQETGPLSNTFTFNVNNPFLTDQAKALLQGLLAPGASTFNVSRLHLDFGARGEDHWRENLRVVGGIEGKFNNDWRYELSVNYGQFDSYFETQGNPLNANLNRAIQAVRNSAGQIVCSVNADTNPANDDPACVPINLFGQGNISQAGLNYIIHQGWREQQNKQFIVSAFMSGDTSDVFNLPGGPIGFALGGEYRREKQYSVFDPVTSSNACGGSCTAVPKVADFFPPAYEIKDVFAEIRAPIFNDVPFFHELTLEAAARISNYNLSGTGTAFAYNAGLIWAPVRDVRLRASYQRSVRAPELSDMYYEPSETGFPGFSDPCGSANINANPKRAKNCAAAGVPTTQTFTTPDGVTHTGAFTNATSQIIGANQGNLTLREEKGDSYTFGAVIQPRFIPGLTLAVDYYNITIKDVIQQLGLQLVLERCYDDPGGINNQYCPFVNRLPNGTFAGQANVILSNGQTVILNNPGTAVVTTAFNFAKLKTSGVDLDVSYNRELGGVRLNTRAIVSYLIARNVYNNPQDPAFYDRVKSQLGAPEWRFQLSTNLDFGKINLNHRLQYIGKQIILGVAGGQYEAFFPTQGRAPTNPDAAPFAYYPAHWSHDFRLEFDATKRFQFFAGVDNAFDSLPPYDLFGTEGDSLYDPTGRFFYAGAKVKF